MSLNKHTSTVPRKEWMKINCKSVESEHGKIDSHFDMVSAGALSAPQAGTVRLYNRQGTDNKLYLLKSGSSEEVVTSGGGGGGDFPNTTKWFNNVDNLTNGGQVGYQSLLDGGTGGTGSLILKGEELLNHAYELKYAGVVENASSGTTVRIGYFINDFPITESKFIELNTQSDESIDGSLFITARDSNDPFDPLQVDIESTGNCKFSNLGSLPKTAGFIDGKLSTQPFDIEVDVRLEWGGTSSLTDRIKIVYARLEKVH